MCCIREAVVADAAGLCELFAQLPKETEYMLLEPGERVPSIDVQAERMKHFEASCDQQMIIAEDEQTGKIIGFIVAKRDGLQRTSHCFSIVIGLLAAYRSNGIGKQLMQAALDWVKQQQGRRVELTVRCDNVAAIALYHQFGFQIEGRRVNSLRINDTDHDEFYMALMLDVPSSSTGSTTSAKVQGLNHITIAVRDLDRSILFYQHYLGFQPLVRWSKGAYLQLEQLWLCLSVGSVADKTDYMHIAFSVDREGMQSIRSRIQSGEIAEWQPNSSEGESLYFLDPDGFKLEVHIGDLQTRLHSLRDRPYENLEWL